MFNWFKKKIELKQDKAIMSSIVNKKGIKIGSEIRVPDNFKCLIYHKGKLFNTLSSGTHKLNNDVFAQLFSYQQKPKSKLKYIKFIAHYVSVSPQTIEFKYKKVKYVAEFGITDPHKFCELMLLYNYKVDKDEVYDYLIDIFKEVLKYLKGNFSTVSGQVLKKYGITIENLGQPQAKSSIFDDNGNNVKIQSIDNNPIPNPAPPTDKIEQNTQTTNVDNSVIAPTIEFPKCPKCGERAKFNTTYCLRCGNRLQD